MASEPVREKTSEYLDDARPRMHLPIGTALVGSLFAANMAAIVLTLFSLS